MHTIKVIKAKRSELAALAIGAAVEASLDSGMPDSGAVQVLEAILPMDDCAPAYDIVADELRQHRANSDKERFIVNTVERMIELDGVGVYTDRDEAIFAAICVLAEEYVKLIGGDRDTAIQGLIENLDK